MGFIELMIDHITIYVKDLAQSKLFYVKTFEPFGWNVSFGEEDIFWAFDIGNGALFEIAQYKETSPLTPCHVAFRASDHAKVHAFYEAAIAAGAKDNGAPGPRPHYTPHYYACFVYDPSGHNIEAVFDNWPQ